MAALLALYGERPTTAQGLTRALLNHERRYWHGIFSGTDFVEPERYAELLLALTTLAGGFPTPKAAHVYWKRANWNSLSPALFGQLFHVLMPLYPGKQGLQAVRPDLLGEALVAQALLRPTAAGLLDAVLNRNANQSVQLNALTVLARLADNYHELHETLIEALVRHFAHCCHAFVSVAINTPSNLPKLAEEAFSRLPQDAKSQVTGLIKSLMSEESVQLARFYCLVAEYLVYKCSRRHQKKPNDIESLNEYASVLTGYSVSLYRNGRNAEALDYARQALEIHQRLVKNNPNRFDPQLALSWNNYANRLSDAGRNAEALNHARQALEIHQRLAQKSPDRFEPVLAITLINYAIRLNEVGRYAEALDYARQDLEIRKLLAQKDPDRFEPGFADSLDNYANHLGEAGRYAETLDCARQALEIRKRLAQKNPDRFEPSLATSLNNYAKHLGEAGRYAETLGHARQALEIRKRLAQKNPDRFEPELATSLSNYAAHLGDAGRNAEVLDYDWQALEIRKRLAQKNPDRFEPELATSLSNYANHLSEAGRYAEALDYARQALEIIQRLTQLIPARFSRMLFSAECDMYLLRWVDGGTDEDDYLAKLDSIPEGIPKHRRTFLQLKSCFVKACHISDQAARAALFKQVVVTRDVISQEDWTNAQHYWLCATAWCATHTPADTINLDWKADWRQYVTQRRGHVPCWMLELARRLEFRWPE